MERDDIVAGGCSGPATVDLTGDRDDDSWDKSYAILREAGLAAESDVAGSSESHDTPLVDDSGITKTDAASFDSFNFQNCLRHAALDRSVVLPDLDLPWETPAWKSIFDDDYNMLSFVEPSRSFSDPPMPVAPGSVDDVVGELVERKKRF